MTSAIDDIDIDVFDDSEFSKSRKKERVCDIALSPIYKLVIKYPTKIMRYILQFGDFYFFIETLSFTVQFFLILMTSAARLSTAGIIFIFIGLFIFSFMLGNTLTMPLWEFIQFRWINNFNPLQTLLDIFDWKPDPLRHEITDIVTNSIIFIFLLLPYFILLLRGNSAFDGFNMAVLFAIPCFKSCIFYLGYFIRAWQSICSCCSCCDCCCSCCEDKEFLDPFVNAMKHTNFDFLCICKKKEESNEENIKKCNCKKIWKRIFFILKVIGSLFTFIYIIWILSHNKIKGARFLLPLAIVFYNSILSFAIDMPVWIANYFNRIDCCKIINAHEGANREIRKNPRFKGFKYVNSICTFLIPIIMIVYVAFLFGKKDGTFGSITEETLWNGTISHFYDQRTTVDKQIMSPMCYMTIYHLNLMQIGAIAAASYFKDLDKVKVYFENSFFRDDDLEIKDMKFVLDKDDHAVLLRADIDIKDSSRNLTIFAVRGSTTSIDWWLDFEIFVSSALISVARWFPILQSYESYASRVISNYMTLPLSVMNKATLTYNYTQEMFNKINELKKDIEKDGRTILFTGHSLGGGLSKVLANKYAIQTVAFSGPGISPIEDKFKHENYDDYFKSKYIDIIPDNDFVPRFEMSGGTKHRVLCEQNGGECHDILRTICQIGLSCDMEYFSGDFCRGRYGTKEYNDMIKLSEGYA